MTDSEKLDLLLEMVSGLELDVGNLKLDVGNLKSDVGNLKSDVQDIKHKVTKIDLTLENEIRVNIKRVAEGHLDLSRILHEAMKPNNEIEMLSIKVNMLESDVKELKHKIS